MVRVTFKTGQAGQSNSARHHLELQNHTPQLRSSHIARKDANELALCLTDCSNIMNTQKSKITARKTYERILLQATSMEVAYY
jgi:hypothetical protein